jgi:biopolymer transport protein ExbB/TolQ
MQEMDALKDILHIIAQGLLIPTMLVLVVLIALSVITVGSLIVEIFIERRHFKVVMADFMGALEDATAAQVPDVIAQSGLLKRQRDALLILFKNRRLHVEARYALAKRLIADDEMRYQRVLGRTDYVARISTMLGLMATLIPLGPGIVALGAGDTLTLSTSLLVAFDATVAGLIVSIVNLGISKLRKHWYENYMISLEAAIATELEKIDLLDEAGDTEDGYDVVTTNTGFDNKVKGSE